MYYSSDNQYDDEYLKNLIKKVNGLRNIKFENSNYTSINITDCNEIYCNNDWYIVKYFDGEIESFSMSYDNRADDELESIINQNIIKLNL